MGKIYQNQQVIDPKIFIISIKIILENIQAWVLAVKFHLCYFLLEQKHFSVRRVVAINYS